MSGGLCVPRRLDKCDAAAVPVGYVQPRRRWRMYELFGWAVRQLFANDVSDVLRAVQPRLLRQSVGTDDTQLQWAVYCWLHLRCGIHQRDCDGVSRGAVQPSGCHQLYPMRCWHVRRNLCGWPIDLYWPLCRWILWRDAGFDDTKLHRTMPRRPVWRANWAQVIKLHGSVQRWVRVPCGFNVIDSSSVSGRAVFLDGLVNGMFCAYVTGWGVGHLQ